MSRAFLMLLLAGLVRAESDPAPKLRLRAEMRAGSRYTGSNTVAYTLKTEVREGERRTSSSESVQRTERFVDRVSRAGESGMLEIHRNYLRLYTKSRSSENGRPTVHQSPLQGRTVVIREHRRRREVSLDGRGAVDPAVRRVAGMEIDWRDLFPSGAVGPGDRWKADTGALARGLSAYLRCGTRSHMNVRYEENIVRAGRRQAKLYVDWTVEGMRDRIFYTKVTLAGNVFFDFDMKRVVEVDLAGSMIVRGAVVHQGVPRIVKGQGPVTLKTKIRPAPVDAAAKDG